MASNLKKSSDSVDELPINISNDNGSSEPTQDLKICPFTKDTESPVVENEKNKEPNVFNVNGHEQNSKLFLQAPFEEQQNSGKAGAKMNSSAARKQRKGIARVEKCTFLDSEVEMLNTGKYGRLVLIEHMPFAGPQNVLVSSTTLCKIPFRIEYDNENKKCCKIIVNERVVVSVSDASKKIARDVAISCALEKLKDVCYTLKVKKQRVPDDLIVEHSMISSLAPSSAAHSENHAPIPKAVSLATPLPEDNIGSKLMKSMGWTGGGLGKAEQGIQEPVSVSLRNDRAGLGAQKTRVDAIFKTKARNYLLRYLAQNFPPNLLLKADEFSALERDAVHQIAKALGLQSIAIGKNDDAYLKISRKNSVYVIAAQMLRQGVFSDEYHELVVPRNPSSIHSEAECLHASDFPHLCHQSSVGQMDDEKSWPKQTVGDALVGDIWKLLEAYKVEQKEPRKHDRRRLKLLKKRVEKNKIKPKQNTPKQYSLEAIAAGPYGSFFLIEYENAYDHVTRIMVDSEQNNFVRVKYQHGKYKTESYCRVFVNDYLLTTTFSTNKKEARNLAIKDAYEKLKQICYTLKIKLKINSDGTIIDKALGSEPSNGHPLVGARAGDNGSDGNVGQDAARTHAEGSLFNEPWADNVGSKLMRAMGWTGGGLGKDEQGRKQPVSTYQRVSRQGLGVNNHGNLREKVMKMLKDYIRQDSPFDLVFTSDFSKEERATLHFVAQKLGLKSKSYGKDADRCLVISKKKDFCQIVENMLRSGVYSNSLYELIKPPISLPPEINSQSENENVVKLEDKTASPNKSLKPSPNSSSAVKNVAPETASPIKSLNPSPSASSSIPTMRSILSGRKEVSTGNNSGTLEKKIVFMSGEFSVVDIRKPCSSKPEKKDAFSGPFGRLILIDDGIKYNNIQLIERSANGCHIPFKFEYANARGGMICKLVVNNTVVASQTAPNKRRAREGAVNRGVEKLQEVCYTLKSQMKMSDDKITVIKVLKKPFKKSRECDEPTENIICISKEVDWAILGMPQGADGISQNLFKEKTRNFLRRYVSEGCPYDLVFSPIFTAENRSIIQKIASGLALKTNLYEHSKQDFLVISKRLSPLELAAAILRSGGNASFDSITPGTFDCL